MQAANTNRRTFVVFAAAAILYLCIPTKDFYWDGVGFALVLEHPHWFPFIEANHPIYIGFGWALYSLVHAIAPALSALRFLQALNSIFAAGCVVLVYAMARKLFAAEFEALLLSLLFALSATWWKFATDANAYIPAIFLLLVAARLLLSAGKPRPFTVAIVHTCAMLFHVLSVLFAAPAAVALCRQNRRNAGVYVASTLALSTAAFYLCFFINTAHTGVGEFLRWITWHTPDAHFSFSLGRSLWFTVRGTGRLALGGRLDAFHSGVLELLVLLVLVASGAYWTFRARIGKDRESLPFPRAFLWIWVAVYVLFLIFWLPQNTFYRLFYLPPLVFVAGVLFRGNARRWVLFGVVAFLGIWNYLFYIHPNSLVENNPVLRAALAMRPEWKPGTWVYVGSLNTDDWTVFCFNPQVNFKDVDLSHLPEMTGEMAAFEKAGHQVWIDQSARDVLQSSEAGRMWLSAHTRPGWMKGLGDSKHKITFTRIFA